MEQNENNSDRKNKRSNGSSKKVIKKHLVGQRVARLLNKKTK